MAASGSDESVEPHEVMNLFLEAVVQRCSVKKLLLEISQNSQENTCARVSFLIKLQAASVFQSINIITYNSSRNREILLHII